MMKTRWILLTVLTLFLTCITVSAQVEQTDVKVYNKGIQVTLSTPIVADNGRYYIALKDLQAVNLQHDLSGDRIYIYPANAHYVYSELKIDCGSNVVYIDRRVIEYENPCLYENDIYYISVDLIAQVFSIRTSIDLISEEIWLYINDGELATVYGTVFLPEGQTAPKGGLEVTVYLTDNSRNSSGGSGGGGGAGFHPGLSKPRFPSPTLQFPSGTRLGKHTITIPEGENRADYLIETNIDRATRDSSKLFAMVGGEYLGISEGSSYIDLRRQKDQQYDIQILQYFKGQNISGTITLPEPAAEDVDLTVCATGGEGERYFTNSDSIQIRKGERNAVYTLQVRDGNEYQVEIQFEDGKYMRMAQPISVLGQDVEMVDFAATPARKVSGTIKLPKGKRAITDLEVSVTLQHAQPPYYYLGYDDFTIPAGSDDTLSFPFELYDDMGTNSAVVYYSVWSEDFPANQLFRWGHYKRNGGTKSNVHAADVLDIKSADVSGLEMEMLKGRGTPVKFVNASTDTSAENGLFAVVQGTEPKARSRISSMPTMQISAYCESKWVEETQEWEDTYTFILPEEYDSYSFGVYTDTHDKQFYWDGEAFTEEASVSKVYDFEEMKDVPLSYDGYDADLPIRIQDFQYNARYGYGTLKYFYDSDFPSGDFTIYVAVYDEHKRLKEVVTSNLCMEQAKSQELPVKFSNPLEETDTIKVFAWTDRELTPLAQCEEY